MEHSELRELLSDYSMGKLEGERARLLETHLGSCPECRHTLKLIGEIRRELETHGESLLEGHPDADSLVSFALDDGELETPDYARIGLHIRSCSNCESEVRKVREIQDSLHSPSQRLKSVLRPIIHKGNLALLALVLLVALLPLSRNFIQPTGGASRILYLEPTLRGAEPALPSLVLDEATAWISLALVSNPESAEQSFVLRILEDGNGTEIFRHEGLFSEAWDPSTGVLSLVFPSRCLRQGLYRVELMEDGQTVYLARFLAR
ncbi:MAG: zf-HC2 domain-containing protein [Candidatus Krumholzibacteria bacterium]|jgi:hypothetical protein|nr:zf-HC2 domain-containing protein [Candidatus Krumholzibacteria bacterium]MDP6796590.1 zf-HC2 domain-containing protein [Candidatus Krumholzibacteria bacterium]MDP7021583.1 zf-HC2 domain-containing protein [Candidatus Krumholzibacteria bacterium]